MEEEGIDSERLIMKWNEKYLVLLDIPITN